MTDPKIEQANLFVTKIIHDWVGNDLIHSVNRINAAIENRGLIALVKGDYRPIQRMSQAYGPGGAKEQIFKAAFGPDATLDQLMAENDEVVTLVGEMDELASAFDESAAPYWELVREGIINEDTDRAMKALMERRALAIKFAERNLPKDETNEPRPDKR